MAVLNEDRPLFAIAGIEFNGDRGTQRHRPALGPRRPMRVRP
jgi:hypothetical protein